MLVDFDFLWLLFKGLIVVMVFHVFESVNVYTKEWVDEWERRNAETTDWMLPSLNVHGGRNSVRRWRTPSCLASQNTHSFFSFTSFFFPGDDVNNECSSCFYSCSMGIFDFVSLEVPLGTQSHFSVECRWADDGVGFVKWIQQCLTATKRIVRRQR